MREFDFINWIRQQSRFDGQVVLVGPGDDCAVVRLGEEKLLLTTDQVLDGVHVNLEEDGPEAAGRKAAARALSDIAAMAGEPLAMLATLAAPQGFTQEQAEAVYRGLRWGADEFNCPLVGGDLAAWSDKAGQLQISATVVGRAGAVHPVLRKGAKVGDALCVTGQLGGAWNSKRDLSFTPRVYEARLLASGYPLHAMIDISDGLAADLGQVLQASLVGAELDAASVPIHPDASERDDPLAAALYDGEDYELLFALPPDVATRLLEAQPLGVKVTRIGTVVKGSGIVLLREGKKERIEIRGWEHQT